MLVSRRKLTLLSRVMIPVAHLFSAVYQDWLVSTRRGPPCNHRGVHIFQFYKMGPEPKKVR